MTIQLQKEAQDLVDELFYGKQKEKRAEAIKVIATRSDFEKDSVFLTKRAQDCLKEQYQRSM